MSFKFANFTLFLNSGYKYFTQDILQKINSVLPYYKLNK